MGSGSGTAGGGSFAGTATDFQDAPGDHTGELTIGSGIYGADPSSATGARVAAAIAGTLTRESGEVIAINGAVVGRFVDTDGAFIVGGSTGTVTLDGTSAGIGSLSTAKKTDFASLHRSNGGTAAILPSDRGGMIWGRSASWALSGWNQQLHDG